MNLRPGLCEISLRLGKRVSLGIPGRFPWALRKQWTRGRRIRSQVFLRSASARRSWVDAAQPARGKLAPIKANEAREKGPRTNGREPNGVATLSGNTSTATHRDCLRSTWLTNPLITLRKRGSQSKRPEYHRCLPATRIETLKEKDRIRLGRSVVEISGDDRTDQLIW